MKLNTKGIINALFFLLAFFILIANKFDVLTIFGLVISIFAIYFSFANRFYYSATLGITTATLSFIAQFATVFCLNCTMAATSFALGGLISLVFLRSEKIIYSFSMIGLLIIGIFFMISNLPQYYQQPVVTQQVAQIKPMEENKAKLYISSECRGCDSVATEFIQADPEGRYWQPVIVPQILLARGEAILKEKGYKGNVHAAPQSPTGFVPVLQVEDQYYRGREITPEKIERR